MKLVWNGDKIIEAFNKQKKSVELASAKAIEAKAKAGCPVDKGNLKGSIRMVKSKHKDGGYVVLAGDETTRKDGVDYTSFVELGTNERPGIPFLRRAAENEGSKFESRIANMMKAL